MSIDVTETIKGQAYRLIKLDPLQGGRLATRVAQQLSGALGDVDTIRSLLEGRAASEGVEKIAESLDTSKLLAALAGGVSKVDANALYDCALECVRGRLFCASGKLHDDHAFNAWFSEHPDSLLLVLVWALKVNCAGFFGLGGKD